MSANGFTPTEKKIADLLSDGQPHTILEFLVAVWGSGLFFWNRAAVPTIC